MADHSRVEAHGYALLLTRRALTQALHGLPDPAWLWRPAETGSLGELARSSWQTEFHWIWPLDLPAPALAAEPDLIGTLYALVRHRAVTEELLMRAADADLDARYASAARANGPAAPLAAALNAIVAHDLAAAQRAHALRRAWHPGWEYPAEAWDRARAAADAIGISA